MFDRNDYPGGSIFARPTGLSVDESFIYWADSGTGAILRGPKNGSGAVTSLYTAANYPGTPDDVFPWDLKVSNGLIYWTDAGVSQVLRGATDGSSPVQTLFTTASGRVNLGMAIEGDLIYWGDTDNEGHAGSVQGGSLSGMGLPETLYELAEYPSSAVSAAPTGIAAQDGQLYWVDSLTKQVLTASSSGSGQISILFDIEDYPGAPDYISPTFLTIVSSSYDADFNDDGIVDGQDFLVWQRGQSPAPVGADDLALWKQQFGSTPQLQSNQSIPEPLTITLALTACLAAIAVGRLRS